MRKPKDILNRLKWGERCLEKAKITVLHRGVPNDQKEISGADIVNLLKSYMLVKSGEGVVQIPYHRILRIEVDQRVIWDRSTVRLSKRRSEI